MKRIVSFTFSFLLLSLGVSAQHSNTCEKQSTPTKEGYKLLWADEFNTPGTPNPAIWTAETGGHGWGNNESQYYTDRPDNAVVANGKLIITAKKEDYQGSRFTSARLITKGKKDFTYGRIEVSAKLPAGKGTWPAIWMLGTNIGPTPWPTCGEIDIMEHVGFDMNRVHGSIHTQAYNHPAKTQKTASIMVEGASEKFHVYAVEWTPTKIEFFVDNQLYYSYQPDEYTPAKWPFANPCFLILNLAIGGNWGGEIDETSFPKIFEVEYVRVYQQI
jgi:beta-glucanase (GH16 family)